MATWFNVVASDLWDKCDNWHYYHRRVFRCFPSHASLRSECTWHLFLTLCHCHLPKCFLFYAADYASNTSTPCIYFCWQRLHNCQIFEPSAVNVCCLLRYTITSTPTALHTLKAWFYSHLAVCVVDVRPKLFIPSQRNDHTSVTVRYIYVLLHWLHNGQGSSSSNGTHADVDKTLPTTHKLNAKFKTHYFAYQHNTLCHCWYVTHKFPLTDFKTCQLTCRSGVTAGMAVKADSGFTVKRWKEGNVNRRAAKLRMWVFDANKTRVRKLTRSRRQCFHSTLVLKTAVDVITVWIHIQNHQICMQRRTPSSKCIWVKLVAETKAHLPEICLAHSKQRWIPCKHFIYW